MRALVVATVTVVVVSLTGGCASDGDSNGADEPRGDETSKESTSPDPESPTPSSPSPESGDTTDVVDSEACAEVRTGIDAYNADDFEATIEHFEKAIPLAEEQDDGSVPASQLIEAVHYYAELAAEDYPEAARTSPEFAKYKTITLGQCYAPVDGTSESPGEDI